MNDVFNAQRQEVLGSGMVVFVDFSRYLE